MVLVHLPSSSSSLPSNAKDYSHAYHHILRAARRQAAHGSAASGAVLLLVATDADAICAARSLARLLTEDEVMYRIAPVDGYRTFQRVLQEDVAGNADLHTLILLNLGALLPLPTVFGPESVPLPQATHVHLIDSHRPWNLDNIFSTTDLMDRLWVWDDGEIVSKLHRESEAYQALEFDLGSDEEEEEESEAENNELSDSSSEEDISDNDHSVAQDTVNKRRRTSSASSAERSRKRRPRTKKTSQSPDPTRLTLEQRDIYRAILSRYFNRGTGLGMSAAGMIFVLAEALGRGENEGLWLAILGLTHQYISTSIPYYTYEEHAASMASDVVALNPLLGPPMNAQSASAQFAKSASADDGRIRMVDNELRFTLYRHWSLENSMYHTPYVAGKLGVWREKGLTKIRGMLAKMGFSLIHSRQHYNNMPLDLRNSLTSRLEAIAPEYGLTELIFKSFIRSYGYRSNPLSAMDTVEGLNALLIAATGIRIEVQDEALTFSGAAPGGGGGDGRGAYGGQGTPISSELFGARRMWSLERESAGISQKRSDGKENEAPDGTAKADGDATDAIGKEMADAASSSSEAWIRNFFITFEALDTRKTSSLHLLNSSLSLSRSLHSAILTVGTSLIDKQSIRSLKSFRLAILRDGPHVDLFATQPAMLTKLGQWLTDALRDIVVEQQRKREELKRSKRLRKGGKGATLEQDDESATLSKALPFVICALNVTTSTYLVVGLIGSPEFGEIHRNRFGLAFQDAIRKSGARSRNEGWWDTSAVEIRKEDLPSFVERLHLKS